MSCANIVSNMTEAVFQPTAARRRASSQARLRRRHAAERRFRAYGLIAIIAAGAILALLLGNIVMTGSSAFFQTFIKLDVTFDAELIDPDGTRDPRVLRGANYRAATKTDYKLVAMCGDGKLDACVMRSLGAGDLAFPRQSTAAASELQGADLKATKVVWSDASQIVAAVRKRRLEIRDAAAKSSAK